MTAPPEGLGAHDCSASLLREFQQAIDAGLKFAGHHVIGVAAEGFIAPGGIRRIRPRPAPATQFRKVDIRYACLREGLSKIFLSKLGVAACAGKLPDIGEGFDL